MSQERLAKKSERKILEALHNLGSPQTWSKLIEATKLSSRTLRKALLRLEKQGLIYRKVDNTGKYPPSVFYGLTEEGKEALAPIIFAMKSYDYAVGLYPIGWDLQKIENGVRMQQNLKNEFASLPLAERLQIIARRLFARSLFSLLLTLKTDNPAWFENAWHGLMLTPELLIQLNLFVSGKPEIRKVAKYNEDTILGLVFTEFKLKPNYEELEKALIRAFPEEYKTLEKIYEEINRKENKFKSHINHIIQKFKSNSHSN